MWLCSTAIMDFRVLSTTPRYPCLLLIYNSLAQAARNTTEQPRGSRFSTVLPCAEMTGVMWATMFSFTLFFDRISLCCSGGPWVHHPPASDPECGDYRLGLPCQVMESVLNLSSGLLDLCKNNLPPLLCSTGHPSTVRVMAVRVRTFISCRWQMVLLHRGGTEGLTRMLTWRQRGVQEGRSWGYLNVGESGMADGLEVTQLSAFAHSLLWV